jgi:uncharacterized protein YjbI with pentapeptide repeats
MPNAKLYQANLNGAMLHDTNLTGADLSGANLSNADLSGAVLNEADLSGATLAPIKYSLEEAARKPSGKAKAGGLSIEIYPPRGLRPNQLFSAKVDSHTVLPADMETYLKQQKESAN